MLFKASFIYLAFIIQIQIYISNQKQDFLKSIPISEKTKLFIYF